MRKGIGILTDLNHNFITVDADEKERCFSELTFFMYDRTDDFSQFCTLKFDLNATKKSLSI